jgi:hypothetical protein
MNKVILSFINQFIAEWEGENEN